MTYFGHGWKSCEDMCEDHHQTCAVKAGGTNFNCAAAFASTNTAECMAASTAGGVTGAENACVFTPARTGGCNKFNCEESKNGVDACSWVAAKAAPHSCVVNPGSVSKFPAGKWVGGNGTGIAVTLQTMGMPNKFERITFTAGTGYKVGDVIMVADADANALPELSSCAGGKLAYTLQDSDFETPNGLKAPIMHEANKYIGSASITTSGSGMYLGLRYTSTADAITSIRVESVGQGYVIDRGGA
jgi:hypothetical protein